MSMCYIIEQGSYSDYRVVGIFSTKDKAEQALEYMKSGECEEPKITERRLDPGISQLNEGLTQFQIIFRDLKTGGWDRKSVV